MKFDSLSFLVGGLTFMIIRLFIDISSDVIAKKLNKKHTGGSFLESYKDNKNGDDNNGGIS